MITFTYNFIGKWPKVINKEKILENLQRQLNNTDNINNNCHISIKKIDGEIKLKIYPLGREQWQQYINWYNDENYFI